MTCTTNYSHILFFPHSYHLLACVHYSGCAGGGDERATLLPRSILLHALLALLACLRRRVAQGVRAAETSALHWSTLHITTRITRFTACITQAVRAAETSALHWSALHITTRITRFTACITQAVRAAETNALHWSALHYACFSASNVDVVERLVKAGGVCVVYVVYVLWVCSSPLPGVPQASSVIPQAAVHVSCMWCMWCVCSYCVVGVP